MLKRTFLYDHLNFKKKRKDYLIDKGVRYESDVYNHQDKYSNIVSTVYIVSILLLPIVFQSLPVASSQHIIGFTCI